MDTGFDGNKEAMLTFNPFGVAIELNMSNDVAYLDNILTYEANRPFLYGCHNFIHKRELHCRMISLKNVASVLKGRYSDSCFYFITGR